MAERKFLTSTEALGIGLSSRLDETVRVRPAAPPPTDTAWPEGLGSDAAPAPPAMDSFDVFSSPMSTTPFVAGSAAAPLPPAVPPAQGWDPLMIRWLGRVAGTLVQGPRAISEMITELETSEGSRFDFDRFSAAFQALKDMGAVKARTTDGGVVYTLTDAGRELV